MTPEAAAAGRWLAERGSPVPDAVLSRLDLYAKDVLEYGARANLTAAEGLPEVWRRHVLDGLAALAPLRARLGPGPARVVDLGCGGGFVGVALAAAWPEAEVWLVDSVYRKVGFLTMTTANLGLTNARPMHARADGSPELELLRSGGGSGGRAAPAAAAVVARALAPRPEALALAGPLARPGGWTMLYASDSPGGDFERYRLPGEDKDRFLSFTRRTEAG